MAKDIPQLDLADLKRLSKAGKIEDVTPESQASSATTSPTEQVKLDDYLPILVALSRPRRYLTAHPTFKPKNLTDSIQFAKISTTYYLDLYINNAWFYVALTAV